MRIAVLIIFLLGMVNGLLANASAGISIWFYWLVELTQWVLVPFVLLRRTASIDAMYPPDYGLSVATKLAPALTLCLVCSILLAFVTYIAYEFSRGAAWYYFPFQFLDFHYQKFIPNAGIGRWVVILYYALSAALVEEIFYRGMLGRLILSQATSALSSVTYISFSSILFALVHWESGLHNIFGAFVVGVIFSSVFVIIRSLWPLIGAHLLIGILSFS